MRDGEACVSPMCLVDSFEDKLGLWDIGVPDRMLGPGWGLGPGVRSGTASSNASLAASILLGGT